MSFPSLGQAPDTLHVRLDMQSALREGWLDAGTETVGLRGDLPPLSWGTTYPATDEDGDGIYEASIPFRAAADSVTFAFKIKVDGVDNPNDGWQNGPNHLASVHRGRGLRLTRAWSDEAIPPSTITGRVDVLREIESDGLAARDVYVYLPPGYEDSDRRYPVLYLHDGQNVFDATASGREWQMDEAAEALIRDGAIEPLIIVGVSNTAERIEEYTPTRQIWQHRLERSGPPDASGPFRTITGSFATEDGDSLHVTVRSDTLLVRIPGSDIWQQLFAQPDSSYFVPRANITLRFSSTAEGPAAFVVATKPPQGGVGNRYGDLLVHTLKPLIDQTYRTRPEPRWTALGGSSLGGLITMHLGLRHPDVFGWLLVASPSVWWDDRWILRAVDEVSAVPDQRIWLYVGTGEGEGTVSGARALRDALRDRGWSSGLRYVETPGAGHNEAAWAARAPDMLRFLFRSKTRVERVSSAVAFVAEPFSPSDVRLLDSPFREAMERDVRYLQRLEPDRFLHNFRAFAGLEPKAPLYGGWESMEIAGHSLGHYLTALSLYYAQSADTAALHDITYIVDELGAAQEAGGDGYVAGIPGGRDVFDAIRSGTVEGEPFNLNGLWVPWYTLHKLFAGLNDAYRHAGNERALQVSTALADWADRTLADLTPAQWQEMLKTEHGGMNEVLADLYAVTGERRYLDLSRRFHHQAILGPLAHGVADLEGKHVNTQVPKVIGALRQYELLGLDSLRATAEFFWEQIVEDHTYVIGGNSQAEHLGPPGRLADRLGANTAETCNTYNMLKLTRRLFALSGDSRYAEYYEQALYNHILASQDPNTGMVTYFVSLKPGHFKTYSTPELSFWCCVGSGMENHVRYGEGIYFHDGAGLFVNLFIPSEVTWREKGVVVRQETRFPDEPTTRFHVSASSPVPFVLRIRHPAWAEGRLVVRINDEPIDAASEPGGYLELERRWSDGDLIEVTLPMRLRLEPMPDRTDRVAVLYGPIVLAGALGGDGLPDDSLLVENNGRYSDWPTPAVPVLAADPARVEEWLKPVAGARLTFRTEDVGRPEDVTLIPFFRMHHQRYTVYWDLVAKRP